jgi:hypothetical protein
MRPKTSLSTKDRKDCLKVEAMPLTVMEHEIERSQRKDKLEVLLI